MMADTKDWLEGNSAISYWSRHRLDGECGESVYALAKGPRMEVVTI